MNIARLLDRAATASPERKTADTIAAQVEIPPITPRG